MPALTNYIENLILMDAMVRSDGGGDCTILGESKKVSAAKAALINSTSGHSLDLDDGHQKAIGHPAVFAIKVGLYSSAKSR